MKYTVYLTTNTATLVENKNPIYIGVHQMEDPNIQDDYIGCGVYRNQPSTYINSRTPFQAAVKKYGQEVFKKEILYVFDTAEEAYNKEKEIVTIDFIKQKHVYNACIGGKDKWYLGRPIYQFTLDGKLVKKWDYGIFAYEYFNLPREKFNYAIFDKHPLMGYLWSTKDKINPLHFTECKKYKDKQTFLFSKDLKLLKRFDSQYDCMKYLGCKSINKIYSCISNKNLYQKMYYISYDESFNKDLSYRYCYIHKNFYLYKNGIYVGSYVGKEILSIINDISWNSFVCRLRRDAFYIGDFYISYEKIEGDNIPQKTIKNKVAVDVYDKNGKFIETMHTIKDTKIKYHLKTHALKHIKVEPINIGEYMFKSHSMCI